MADITITYKGQTISEINATGNKTLKTSGKYCEGDILLSYVKTSSTYIVVKSSKFATITCDEQTYTLTGDEIYHAFPVGLGTHTVTATREITIKTESVTVSQAGAYFIEMLVPILPVEYQEVEWLQSYGNQYIITNFYGDYRYTVETKFQYTANENDKAIFGSGTSGSLIYHMTWFNNKWYMCAASGSESNKDFGVPCTNLTEVRFNTSDRKLILNDIEFTPISGTVTSAQTISLFGRKTNTSSPTNLSKAKMYYFNIYNYSTETYEAKLVPCYNKSTYIKGMYDIVNNTFYTNNGYGNFGVGPDVY